MLLLYRVEYLVEAKKVWKTYRVVRPHYEQTIETEIERYGLFKLKKRNRVVSRRIHNEEKAKECALNAAMAYMRRALLEHDSVRITRTTRGADGELNVEWIIEE